MRLESGSTKMHFFCCDSSGSESEVEFLGVMLRRSAQLLLLWTSKTSRMLFLKGISYGPMGGG